MMRKNSNDSSFSPLFKNTKSKLYKRKSSADQVDQSFGKHNDQNSSQYWKSKGNEEFKNRNFDKAIEHYTKAIVPISPQRKSTLEKASSTRTAQNATKKR